MFTYVNNPQMGKLDPCTIEGILLGYRKNTKGWIVFLSKSKKVIISQNVKFFKLAVMSP